MELFSSGAIIITYLVLKWRGKCLFLMPPSDSDKEVDEKNEDVEKVDLENKLAISNPCVVSDSPSPESKTRSIAVED